MTITIFVKPTATGVKITLTEIDEEMLVSDLKNAIAQHSPIPAEEQRVIYKGQILKNERSVASYGIGNEHVLHLVKGKSESSSPSAATASATVAPGPQNMMGMDPSMMADMLNNPMLQSVLNNPELMRTMLSSTPGFREVMDRNPEIAQALNNPAHLRQMLETMRNPSLMAEQMRQTDRQLSNIEAMPEGFNRLRQMFESVQEPLMNASNNASAGDGGVAANPLLAALLGGGTGLPNGSSNQPTATTTGVDAAPVNPNANPLPNPWASTGTGAVPGAGGLGGLGGMAGLGGMGGLGGLGGLGGGLPPGMNMETMMQMMQNPAMQSMMRSMSSNPALLQQMLQSNPMMRNAPPQVRDMMTNLMSNPQQLQSLLDPSNITAMMQMQNAMRQLQSSGLMGNAGGLGGEAGGMMPGMDFASLFSQMGAGGTAPLAPPPVADPEVAYAAQLQQLQDMGFYDRATNIAALQATGGNVNAAVERLLSQ